jgi:antitoxin VapB
MRKKEGKLIIQPVPPRSLLALLVRLDPIDDPFSSIDDTAPEPVTLATEVTTNPSQHSCG